jgi:hypothetical protein
MDLIEALGVLSAEATKLAGRSHAELSCLVDQSHHLEAVGPSGTKFQVEIWAVWDNNKPGQTLRLLFSVDDGGVRAFVPLTRGALVAPGAVFDGKLH